MSNESPEEQLERFREMAQHVTDALELAKHLAVSNDLKQRALARQQLPMWVHYVGQWSIAIGRLEHEITEGAAD